MLQVREVSRKLGVNPQTLYFYERIGLIPSPDRTESGYRLYSDKDLERLTFIARAKALGLTLEEIGEILALKDKVGMDSCFVVRDRLQAKVAQIQQTIQKLQELRDDLLPMIEQCDRRVPATAPRSPYSWGVIFSTTRSQGKFRAGFSFLLRCQLAGADYSPQGWGGLCRSDSGSGKE